MTMVHLHKNGAPCTSECSSAAPGLRAPLAKAEAAAPADPAAAFLEDAKPMLAELAAFVVDSGKPGADPKASVRWDVKDPESGAVVAGIAATRLGAVAATDDKASAPATLGQRLDAVRTRLSKADPTPGVAEGQPAWRAVLLDQVSKLGDRLRSATIEEAMKALEDVRTAVTDAWKAETVGDGSTPAKVDVAEEMRRAQSVQAQSKGATWPQNLAKGIDQVIAADALKTAAQLGIRDVGAAAVHDAQREMLLAKADAVLAREGVDRRALQTSDELGLTEPNEAIRHDVRRERLLARLT